jgi:hypothetical protein
MVNGYTSTMENGKRKRRETIESVSNDRAMPAADRQIAHGESGEAATARDASMASERYRTKIARLWPPD